MSAILQSSPKLYAIPAPEIVFEVEEGRPRVPDALYSAVCTGCDLKPTFKTLKVYIRFRIAEGEYQDKDVFAAFTVGGRIIPGHGPGTGPRPKLTRRMGLFRMLCRVLNLPINTKPHRVSSKELVGKLCRIKTRTVSKDYRQREIPEPLRYSVVEDVLAIEAG